MKWKPFNISFHVVYQVRRIVFVAISIYLKNLMAFQVMAILQMNVCKIIFQGLTEFLETRTDNNLELFNEWIISVSGIHMILFSDFVPDLEAQYIMGHSLNAVVFF